MLEKEREKLPRVDRNAVEELNAYVVGHRDGRIETMASNIYIFGFDEEEFRRSVTA